jgi:glycosyltransferase involved in cell wall biosynthesis
MYSPNVPVSVAGSGNNMIHRSKILGYDLWQELTKDTPSVIYGAGTDHFYGIEEYSKRLISHKVFLNTTQESIMPMTIYDAMASGMPIVTTATCGIPEVIEHGVTGLMSNDPRELKDYLNQLFQDDQECARLGSNAQKKVVEFFNGDRMAKEWKTLIESKL